MGRSSRVSLPVPVPEGSSRVRRIEVLNVYGADNTRGGIDTSGDRILSGVMDVQNADGVTLACSGTGEPATGLAAIVAAAAALATRRGNMIVTSAAALSRFAIISGPTRSTRPGR